MKKKKNLIILCGLLAAVGIFLYFDQKMNFTGINKSKLQQSTSASSTKKEVSTVTILILPKVGRFDKPDILNLPRNILKDKNLIPNLEKELSDEKLKVNIEIDTDYALIGEDYSALKNRIVIANSNYLYRMSSRNANLKPLMTFTSSKETCSDENTIVVLKDSPIVSIEELKNKRVMIEGLDGAPAFAFTNFSKDIIKQPSDNYTMIFHGKLRKTLISSLVSQSVDALFLQSYKYDNLEIFTSLGKVNNNEIEGLSNLRVLHTTSTPIPCGFVMATPEISKDQIKELTKKLQYVFMKETLGIMSFNIIESGVWEKATEFMQKNDDTKIEN